MYVLVEICSYEFFPFLCFHFWNVFKNYFTALTFVALVLWKHIIESTLSLSKFCYPASTPSLEQLPKQQKLNSMTKMVWKKLKTQIIFSRRFWKSSSPCFSRNFFRGFANQTRLKSPSNFSASWYFFRKFLNVSKGPLFNFATNRIFKKLKGFLFDNFRHCKIFQNEIRTSTLYPNFWRYIRSKMRFSRKVVKVQKYCDISNFWRHIRSKLRSTKEEAEVALYQKYSAISEFCFLRPMLLQ